VVPFTLAGFDPGLVAAVLGWEHGIGVRSGCFCAQPYIADLLDLTPSAMLSAAAAGGVPGMVRLSFGAYTTAADVDRAVVAVERLEAAGPAAPYARGPVGTWAPQV
jgi:cysteine desulfurase/selenocysteine lyase